MSTSSSPDPEQLLGAARAGDVSALGELLELYRSYLATLARLQIGRRLQGKKKSLSLRYQKSWRSSRESCLSFLYQHQIEWYGFHGSTKRRP